MYNCEVPQCTEYGNEYCLVGDIRYTACIRHIRLWQRDPEVINFCLEMELKKLDYSFALAEVQRPSASVEICFNKAQQAIKDLAEIQKNVKCYAEEFFSRVVDPLLLKG